MTDQIPSGKQVILFNWNYYRADHTAYLAVLTSHFNIVFLHDYERSDEPEFSFDCSIIYWNDFNSPYELLDRIQPDKIVFNDIETFHQVALNLAAGNRSIPTYVLEHGLRGDYEVDIDIKKFEATGQPPGGASIPILQTRISKRQKSATFRFYLSAIRFNNYKWFRELFLFILYRRKYGITVGLYRLRHPFRWAKHYINITQLIGSYIRKRDGVPENRFIYIGNASLDTFFRNANQTFETPVEKYLLLLDAPFVEGDVFFMTAEEKNRFIERLNRYAANCGCKLYIKLHPISYKAGYLINDENIVYYRNCDLNRIIMQSEGCIHVHLSTLVPVAMLYKPYLFFDAYPEFNVYLKNRPVRIYNYFDFNELELVLETLPDAEKKRMTDDFLFRTDGRSAERLKDALLNTN